MGEQDTAGTPLQESRPDTGAAFLLSGLFSLFSAQAQAQALAPAARIRPSARAGVLHNTPGRHPIGGLARAP